MRIKVHEDTTSCAPFIAGPNYPMGQQHTNQQYQSWSQGPRWYRRKKYCKTEPHQSHHHSEPDDSCTNRTWIIWVGRKWPIHGRRSRHGLDWCQQRNTSWQGMENPVREPIDDWLQLNLHDKAPHQGLLVIVVSRQGSSVAPTPLSTESPLALWNSRVCWFRYPSGSKQLINDFWVFTMPVAGGQITAPSGSSSAQPISTPASATIHDRTFLIVKRKSSLKYLLRVSRRRRWTWYDLITTTSSSLRVERLKATKG